ncbi:MAG: TRAP transporter substrate-binding protein [Bacillota bacterium]|nr:TRAP transporter substrate-binding protein [Bacillota bacterium]
MKKLMSMILLIILVFNLAACASETEPAAPAPAVAVSETDPLADLKEVTLSLNHVGAVDHPYHEGSLKFAELVAEKSNGKVMVDIFPASQIASGSKAIEFVQLGTLDIALESTMALSNFVKEVGVLDLPFIFDSKEEAFKILDGEFGQHIASLAEAKGFKILGWWDNGFRTMSNSVRPITSPEDLKGLKIRVPESKIFISTFQGIGAVPSPMAVSEVFTALQLGTVDGQENTEANFYKNKYYEVNDFYSVTNHIYTAEPLVMSLDKFNSFPPAVQELLMAAGKEAGDYQRQVSLKLDEDLLTLIKDTGVTVNKLEDPAAFKEAVKPVYAEFEADFGELLKKLEDAR